MSEGFTNLYEHVSMKTLLDEGFLFRYKENVEALRMAEYFIGQLKNQLGWEKPVVTQSYFEAMQRAYKLAGYGMIKTKTLDGLYPYYITRVNERSCKDVGYVFRMVVFEEFDIAYLLAQDYVGDEIAYYAARDESKWKPFIEKMKDLDREFLKKENEDKITIYTVEQGQPSVYHTKFQPVTADDMVCDPTVLANIMTDLTTFFSDDSLFQHFGIARRRGLLFDGPPGCGKTMMCKHIATVSKAPVVQFMAAAGCDTPDLIKYFNYMADISPAIAILEDLDSLFKGDMARSNFLNIIDGACTDKNKSLMIIATTNHIKDIDEAITERPSRFDRHYHFDYPTDVLRRTYITKRFASVKHLFEDQALMDVFVKCTDRLSYAHLNEIYTQAALKAINDSRKKLLVSDIETAIENVKAETSKKGKELGLTRQESLAPFAKYRNTPYTYDDED